jgi:uncharacterized protein
MDIIEEPGPVGWTLREAVGVFFGWLFVTFLIGVALGAQPSRGPWVMVLLLFAPPLVLAVMTVLLARELGADGVRQLVGFKRPSVSDVGAGLLYGVGGALVITFVVGFLLQALVHALHMSIPPVQQSLHRLATGSTAPLAILLIVAVAPIAEELFFRGMLFQAFERRFGVWPSAAASAAIFGAVHLEPNLIASVIILVPIFLFGIELAFIFRRRGTIVTPIVAHMLFNGLGVLLIRAGTG